MTAREHADLAALQHEVSGSNELLLPPNDDQDKHTELPGEEWEDVEDEEDEDSTTDKPISHEELGLPPRGSKWSDRVANEHQAWVEQISALCDAYLVYHAGESPLELESDNENHMVKVFCVDIAAEGFKSFPQGNGEASVNLTLIRHGYLSSSPQRTQTAFSVMLLELLAAMQRRGPAVSIEVMAKAFCDMRNVPYEDYFRAQLSAALDAYLMIKREVERRLATTMGRDDLNWRIKNACVACTYKLEGEPPLCYSILITMDGNDSLKRIGEAATADHRTYDSSYYLTRAQVNAFQNEVSRSRKKKKEPEEESKCEKRWKSAKPNNDPRK